MAKPNRTLGFGKDESNKWVIGYMPRHSVKKFSSNMNITVFLEDHDSLRSRSDSAQGK